jgi:hypothetical protein
VGVGAKPKPKGDEAKAERAETELDPELLLA